MPKKRVIRKRRKGQGKLLDKVKKYGKRALAAVVPIAAAAIAYQTSRSKATPQLPSWQYNG